MGGAAARLPSLGRRAFLAVGRQELPAFARTAGVRFLVRLLAPAPLDLPESEVVIGRGPFGLEDEIRLLRRHSIDVVVAKAAGGEATYAKIAAARALSLPVLMVRRPLPPAGPAVTTIAAALDWTAAVMAARGAAHDRDRAHTAGNR